MVSSSRIEAGNARAHCVSLVVAVFLLLAFHWQTFLSMFDRWLGSESYGHAFLVLPIAAYFAWSRRRQSLVTPYKIWWPGIGVAIFFAAVWVVSNLVNLQLSAQVATVALFVALVAAILGPKQVRVFAFPLGYLFFMIPFGEQFVPGLMEWTADFTVGALNLFGIPVLRDGLYFSTPTGSFEVAKACSGIRYLMASTAAGSAYAFIIYTSYTKRVWFILAAVVVPIVANGLRAFAIVLIAHFSDMKLAVGVDHFIYGWIFFGIIVFAMFWVGSFFSDHGTRELETMSSSSSVGNCQVRTTFTSLLFVLGSTTIVLGLSFVVSSTQIVARTSSPVALPGTVNAKGDWHGPVSSSSAWAIDFPGATTNLSATYQHDDVSVELRVATYSSQTQGSEWINSENKLSLAPWSENSLGREVVLNNFVEYAQVHTVEYGAETYTVWSWWQYGHKTTANRYRAKWLELFGLFDPRAASFVAIGVPSEGQAAGSLLREFLEFQGRNLTVCLSGEPQDVQCVSPSSAMLSQPTVTRDEN